MYFYPFYFSKVWLHIDIGNISIIIDIIYIYVYMRKKEGRIIGLV